MENENKPDPYKTVIADLKAQRERIDQAISLLEALRTGVSAATGVATGIGAAVAAGAAQKSSGPVPNLGPGAFLGMSIPDATKKLLASQRRQMSTTEITKEIERGGVVLTSADKVNTVGSVLLRRFYNAGDIVRVTRGVWGLAEWYPGRKFQKGSGKGDENGSKDGSEDTQDESEGVGNEEETKPDTHESKNDEFGDLIG